MSQVNCPTCGALVDSVFDHVDGCPPAAPVPTDRLLKLGSKMKVVPIYKNPENWDTPASAFVPPLTKENKP